MTAPWQLKVLAAAGQPERLELLIYGFIVDQCWDPSDVVVKDVVHQLMQHPAATEIVVRINSLGGNAFGGLAIYNALKAHPAPKNVVVEGVAASAASIIAMAGDHIRLATGAMLMVHGASSGSGGTAADLAAAAEGLAKLNESLVAVYQAKTKLPTAKLQELLAKDSWLTAQEAKELGFADEVDAALVVTPSARGGVVFFNSVGFPADRVPRQPQSAGGSAMNEKALVGTMKVLLGMAETATNEEVLAAFSKMLQGKDPEEKKEPEAPEAPPAPMPPAPGATAAAEQLTAICTVLGTEGKPLDPTAALAEVLRLRTVQPPQIDVALAEGRITPFEAKVLRPLEASAPEQLRSLLASRPKNSAVPLGPKQATPQVENVITDRQRKLAKMAGVKPEEFAANTAKVEG